MKNHTKIIITTIGLLASTASITGYTQWNHPPQKTQGFYEETTFYSDATLTKQVGMYKTGCYGGGRIWGTYSSNGHPSSYSKKEVKVCYYPS